MRKADDASTYPLSVDDTDKHRAEHFQASHEIHLYGKAVQCRITRAARAAAAQLTAPLVVEMELYFSCLVRKALRFRPPTDADAVIEEARLSEHLRVRFRPVTTQHCSLPADAVEPPLEAMPVTRPRAFVPRWLKIDFRHGAWCGEFGY